jgi:hypothetical protein
LIGDTIGNRDMRRKMREIWLADAADRARQRAVESYVGRDVEQFAESMPCGKDGREDMIYIMRIGAWQRLSEPMKLKEANVFEHACLELVFRAIDLLSGDYAFAGRAAIVQSVDFMVKAIGCRVLPHIVGGYLNLAAVMLVDIRREDLDRLEAAKPIDFPPGLVVALVCKG